MQSLITYALAAFAVVLAIGWYIRTYGTVGQRTYVYAHVSSLLSMAAAAGAFVLAEAGDLAQLGLNAGSIAAVTLAAKAADWLNQVWTRQVTSVAGPNPGA